MTIDATQPPAVMPVTDWLTLSDGTRIPYRMTGSGPALVMVHGWSQSGAMFQHQIDALSDRFTVIVPDLRGHGDAPAPTGGMRMARLAADLAELIDHLELESVHLLGWSLGVSVIWAYIDLLGTARIDRLILVDQPSSLIRMPGMSDEEAADAGAIFDVPVLFDLYAALRAPDGDATRAGFVATMVTPTIGRPLYDWILAESMKTPGSVAADLLISHCANDWRDVLPRIDRPTLVIGGSVSHVPTRSQRFVAAQIPGSRYHEFDADHGGAHFPFLEAPEGFTAVVREFLEA